ncbi:dienelactone hydrolase-like protein [Phanerochaete sordida]|uniref:Dienelactone hydrolase-like protein n=1 Tax=Phanerochaete sordida TaxID=48140 RepID=A0A9P3LJA4_9APHY|nr:dienelactone hydrolase-like protein [Phanerochaete sordida]
MKCHCYQGYLLEGEPRGQLVEGAYFAPAPESKSGTEDTPSRAIVVFTDIFGLGIKNPKIIADELAQRVGCDVWVPDLFDGRPPFSSAELEPLLPDTGNPNDKLSLMRKLRMTWFMVLRRKRVRAVYADVVDPRATAFLTKLRAEKKYEKLGGVGYCYGGAVCLRLSAAGLLDALVACHPSVNDIESIAALRVPVAFVCAEADKMFTPALRRQAEEHLEARKGTEKAVEYEFRDYPGTVHGFATRPNPKVTKVVEAYRAALEQTAEWFVKTLHP